VSDVHCAAHAQVLRRIVMNCSPRCVCVRYRECGVGATIGGARHYPKGGIDHEGNPSSNQRMLSYVVTDRSASSPTPGELERLIGASPARLRQRPSPGKCLSEILAHLADVEIVTAGGSGHSRGAGTPCRQWIRMHGLPPGTTTNAILANPSSLPRPREMNLALFRP